jgi:hypothetical protein
MKRNISEKEYKKEAEARWDCLNAKYLRADTCVLLRTTVAVKVVEDKYKYLDYNGKKVKTHFLIIPMLDSVTSFTEFLGEVSQLQMNELEHILCNTADGNESLWLWKDERDRSIKKFHIHYLIFE